MDFVTSHIKKMQLNWFWADQTLRTSPGMEVPLPTAKRQNMALIISLFKGRQCKQVEDEFYVPTMHQFQHEIEDGYRADAATVRIGHDDARFPGK